MQNAQSGSGDCCCHLSVFAYRIGRCSGVEERLQKILSRYGVASRRKAEEMIQEGRVRVNGNTAHLGDTADISEDVIQVDGVRLKKEPKKRYLMLYKPRGYVTTMHCEKGRKHVAELVADCSEKVYPVGRLDMYSEGLLVMTNDGDLANRMMHPRSCVEKVYHVWLSGFYWDAVPKLSQSIEIDGRRTKPARVRILTSDSETAMVEFIITEGRNRQIRRICEAANVTVTRLKRVREGVLEIGDLKPGQWRDLTDEELAHLQNL